MLQGKLYQLCWNDEERRLRAPWRLLIVTGIWFAILTASTTLFSVPRERTHSPLRWTFYFVMIGVFAVGLVWTAGRVLDRRYFTEFGVKMNREWWIDFGFGLALGAVLVSTIFAIELIGGYITIVGMFQTAGPETSVPFAITFLSVAVLYAVIGIEEELAYRGYILTNAAEGFNDWNGLTPTLAIVLAAIFSSILFGFSHLPNQNASVAGVLGIAIGGLIIATAFVLTGELAIPIGVHIAWNIFMGAVFGFPTSGLDYGVHLFELRSTGPSFVTGGAFGPEAGILLIGVCTLGLVALLGWLRVRYGSIQIQTSIAIPKLRWRHE